MCFPTSRRTHGSTRPGGTAEARRALCPTVASWTMARRSAERKSSRDHARTPATRPGPALLLASRRSTSSRSVPTSAGRTSATDGKRWRPSAGPTANPLLLCLGRDIGYLLALAGMDRSPPSRWRPLPDPVHLRLTAHSERWPAPATSMPRPIAACRAGGTRTDDRALVRRCTERDRRTNLDREGLDTYARAMRSNASHWLPTGIDPPCLRGHDHQADDEGQCDKPHDNDPASWGTAPISTTRPRP